MLLALTVLVHLLLGSEIALRVRAMEGIPPIERACYASVLGIGAWLSTLWSAALLHVMTREVLLARTAVAALVAISLWIRRGGPAALRLHRRMHLAGDAIPVIVFCIVPLALWCDFVLWRGTVLPPDSHDALSYHLPKAVLYMRAHGYAWFDFLDPRMRNIPVNYEMLLSETMILQRSDALTEWVSTLFYVLFLIAGAALARRWWNGGWATSAITATCIGGVPVALLHSGADKNDLMVAYFMVAGMVAAGRFITTRQFDALIIVLLSFAMAVGTKPQAAILALCLAPFLLWALVRPAIDWRRIGMAAAVAVAAFLLLGGAVYVSNLRAQHRILGENRDRPGELVMYGDWSNLWQAPYVLLAAPFSNRDHVLYVPWSKEPWYWPRYEIFFSHLGIACAFCAVVMPLVMIGSSPSLERRSISAAAFAAFLIMLPVRFIPHGMYAISLPRYALFIVPVVFAWTVAPFLAWPKRTLPTFIVAAAAGVLFSNYALVNAVNDTFSPLDYALWAREHPGTRAIHFASYRAASIADAIAGPRDTIAFDGEFGSWLQPAFGATLQRPVEFIPAGAGPPQISDDAKWVVIDRGWNIFWGDRRFRDLGDFSRYLSKGHPAPDDVRVLDALRRDSRFELVFYNPIRNQAVFRRIR